MSIHSGKAFGLMNAPLHGDYNRLSVAPIDKLLFEIYPGLGNGISKLSPALVINGSTVLPSMRYKLQNANATDLVAWDYGNTLSLQVGTAPDYNAGSPLHGALEDSARFNAGAYYLGAAASPQNLANDDFHIGVLFEYSDVAGSRIISSRSAGGKGWELYTNGSGQIQFWLSDGTTSATISTITNDMTDGAWYLLDIFGDRSTSMQAYVNGTPSGTATNISGIGSVNDAASLSIGASSLGGSAYAKRIAFVELHNSNGWLDTYAQTILAKERFEKLQGIYAIRSGSNYSPLSAVRVSSAFLEKIEDDNTSSLYNVGKNWTRVSSRFDANGIKKIGLNLEVAQTNLAINSENFALWSSDNAGDSVSSNIIIAPDGTLTGDGLVADATLNIHGRYQAITINGSQHSIAVYAKKGDADFVLITNSTISNGSSWFDLSAGVVGTNEAAILDAGIESLGNGWYRCFVRFTGTVAAHNIHVRSASADNTLTFTGDGTTVNTYVWGTQVELVDTFRSIASSYIPTGAATVFRNGDSLYYDGINNVSDRRGTLVVDAMLQRATSFVSGSAIAAISDGGSNNDRIMFFTDGTKKFRIYSQSTEDGPNVSLVGTTNIFDRLSHEWKASWATNNYEFWTDNIAQGTDVSAPNPPNDIDRINIGANNANQSIFTGLIERVRIYDK